MCESVIVSSLSKTWILDLDGTIVIHNGYKTNGEDTLLPGALEFLKQIPGEDMVVFITSRKSEYKRETEQFLNKMGVRWDYIIYDAPYGERILINDRKPSGIPMAVAINTDRDRWMQTSFVVDTTI